MNKVDVDASSVKLALEEYSKKVLSQTVRNIANELTDEAAMSIGRFYYDYRPKYYRRHYYNFMKKSFRRYYSNPHSTIYRGGIKLTPNMLDDIYEDPTTEVFDTVYSGFHGPASAMTTGYSSVLGSSNNFRDVPRMIPSPMERLINKRDGILANIQYYIRNAQKVVK